MVRLSHSELEGLLAFLRTCDSFPDLESLREGMLPALAELVPCDTNAYNEVDRRTGEPFWIVEPRDSMALADHDAFVRWVHQHPIVAHHARHGGVAVKLSDFVTRSELHGLELYDEFFRPLGIEHQIVIGVPGARPTLIGIPINRSRHDFSERERATLDLLRPHLAALFRRARARSQTRRLVALLERAAATGGRHLLLLDARGGVQAAGPHALTRLRELFGDGGDSGGALPELVSGWLRRRPVEPLVAAGDRCRATLTFLPATAAGESDALLIEDERAGLDAEHMAALGLTPREQDILRLVDRGLTNAQIAAELSVSRRTVDKHLEHVYARLGAPGRTAALAAARGGGSAEHGPRATR